MATAVLNSARFPLISPAGRFGRKENGSARQVLDGGYFEKYGVRTALDLAYGIERVATRYGLRLVPVLVVVSNDADALREPVPGAQKKTEEMRKAARLEPTPTLGRATLACSRPAAAEPHGEAGQSPTPRSPLPIGTARGRDAGGGSLSPEWLTPLFGLAATRSAHGQDALYLALREFCGCPLGSCGDGPRRLDRMVHLAVPKPVPGQEAAPMSWVLSATAAEFLLEKAPCVGFNRHQATTLRRTLEALSGVELARSNEIHHPRCE